MSRKSLPRPVGVPSVMSEHLQGALVNHLQADYRSIGVNWETFTFTWHPLPFAVFFIEDKARAEDFIKGRDDLCLMTFGHHIFVHKRKLMPKAPG